MNNYNYAYLAGLVTDAQKGDSNAFAALYTATYEKQYQYAYRYLKDRYLAQDALQEVYIAALQNLSSLKNPSLFVSWLNRINFRICFNIAKNVKQFPALTHEEAAAYAHTVSPDTPEEIVSQALLKDELAGYVFALPDLESAAVIMKYYYEMPLADIARDMHISKSSVKRYLSKGRKRLQELLEHT